MKVPARVRANLDVLRADLAARGRLALGDDLVAANAPCPRCAKAGGDITTPRCECGYVRPSSASESYSTSIGAVLGLALDALALRLRASAPASPAADAQNDDPEPASEPPKPVPKRETKRTRR